jgi:hypothetical protein
MAINAWKKAIWPGASPNAHMRKAPSKAGNPVSHFKDTHAMDHKRVPGKPEYEGARGKVIETK